MGKLDKIFNDFQLEFALEYIRNFAHLKHSDLIKHFSSSDVDLDAILDSITDITVTRLWNSYDKDSFYDMVYMALEGLVEEGVGERDVKTLRERMDGSLRDDQLEYNMTSKSLLGDSVKPKALDQSEVLSWLEELFDEWTKRFK